MDKVEDQIIKDGTAQQGNNPRNWYFLFVNTKSGNKQGLKYLELGKKKLKYFFNDQLISTVQIFDLFNKERMAIGFKAIKKLSFDQKQNSVRLIVCGGDGTIPWVLQLALQAEVKFQNIVFGILPIGTGNDLSRSVGWGHKTRKFDSKDFSQLHEVVRLWNTAQIGHYDAWDLQIQTFENGAFYEVKNQQQQKIPQKVLTKTFTNYFGIGLDGRIVYQVEKNRGGNSFINKLLYTIVGAKKFFTPMQSIQSVISRFKQKKRLQQRNNLNQTASIVEDSVIDTNADVDENFKLKKGYKGLVCLNCTSYMCGLREVWMTNKSTHQKFLSSPKQQFDDGKLEFMTFNNQLTLALERVMRTGVRVAQGTGPFQIEFHKQVQNRPTYLEVDGESVKVENIKTMKVSRTTRYPQGKIKVLINKET